nr:multidrug efflux SMR transporter [Halomonas faecis]
MTYFYLALAIAAEVIGTSALKASEGFTRPWPSVVVVVGYGLAFFLLSLVLRSLPVGIAYAIWAGLGIVLVTVAGVVIYGETPDLPAVAGIAMIVGGVVVIQLFSKVAAH